jgi:hypothetical protein
MKEMFLHSHRHEMLHFGNSTSCRSGTPLQITLPSVAVRELAHVRFCSSPVHFVKQRHLAGPTTHSIDIAVQLYSTPVIWLASVSCRETFIVSCMIRFFVTLFLRLEPMCLEQCQFKHRQRWGKFVQNLRPKQP